MKKLLLLTIFLPSLAFSQAFTFTNAGFSGSFYVYAVFTPTGGGPSIYNQLSLTPVLNGQIFTVDVPTVSQQGSGLPFVSIQLLDTGYNQIGEKISASAPNFYHISGTPQNPNVSVAPEPPAVSFFFGGANPTFITEACKSPFFLAATFSLTAFAIFKIIHFIKLALDPNTLKNIQQGQLRREYNRQNGFTFYRSKDGRIGRTRN
jgi:hypothetical protein